MFNKPRLLTVTAALTLFFAVWLAYAQSLNADIAAGVLRLHIRANSDAAADQTLKYHVRDRILTAYGDRFAAAESPAESLRIAQALLPEIQAAAADEIARRGFSYPVTATVGDVRFPTRAYGGLTLPAGRYRALRLVIGDGAGENWWCVMYPPLCLADGVTGLSNGAAETLRGVLTDTEYRMVTDPDGAPEIEIRFRLAELVGRYLQK